MIKIDMRKAYDFVDLSFVRSIMEELGFPDNFVRWAFTCVTTVYFSILVNGTPLRSFKATKGLRQGDPLCPYLLTLCMEYLSRLFWDISKDPNFSFYPRCRKVGRTHLLVADDLLMFCKVDPRFMDTMMHTFQGFSRASGLELNESKNSAFIARVATGIKTNVLDILGMPEGSFPFRYLGVPINTCDFKLLDYRFKVRLL